MIGNLANTISNIGLGAVQKAHVVGEDKDLGQAIAQGLGDWTKFKTRQAYIDQLTNEHPEDAAKIAQDPEAYAKMLEDNANAERDQQYKLDILGQQFENALALEDKRNANAIGLAKLAAELKGNQTTGMQNIEYLKTLGYSPEEAAALYYGGQNPNFSFPVLGEKGFNKADEEKGKNYAEDLNTYNDLVSNLPALEQMVDELDSVADKGTHTYAGRVFDTVLREGFDKTSKGDIASSIYETKVNQNLLPLLRQTFGSAFTEKDREQLQKTLGDPYAHPDIKKATLKEFITNKRREVESKKRKLDSYSNNSQDIIDYTQF